MTRRTPCIHELFQAQVRSRPNSIALTWNNVSCTYAELNGKANQLAHFLAGLGVVRGTPVALYLERSPRLVEAIIAVLKAGGCYVPVDLAFPRDRFGFVLEDTSAPVLLTERHLLPNLPATNARIICMDEELEETTGRSSADPSAMGNSGDTAYIIYTSGSTGKPKGVIVSHHNVVRLLQSTEHWFEFGAEDVWALFHSCSFDMSVWELWGSLFYGGRLVIVPYLTTRSPSDFYELLAREKVTFLNQTPSAFRQLIWAEGAARTPLQLSLRCVTCGGEALDLLMLKPWFDRHGDQLPVIVNMYGITETTVHTTYRPIRQEDLTSGVGSVIGVPIPDLQVHLLNEQLQPVPKGEPGEICVGGEGVAKGYLNRAELTAQRFVPDPFSTQYGATLYRSGDLARVNHRGEMEYLGRMDHQVKIRGFRIELGEIESTLNNHERVRGSVVVARDDDSGSKRLIAYIVPKGDRPAIADLREHAAKTLPDYMFPAAFVFLDAFPLTNNGKVDRHALPAPSANRPPVSTAFEAPGDPVEQRLASIWARVLEIEAPGVHDNFFELGGDSIRSIRLLALAQQAGLQFSLQDLFLAPTIAGLAKRADCSSKTLQRATTRALDLCPPEDRAQLPADAEDAYPITKLQLGMFFHNELDPESAVYHDVFSFRIRSPFDLRKLESAIQSLVERHPILRTSFHLAGYSVPVQIVHRSAAAPITVEDLTTCTPVEQDRHLVDWINLEKHRPFDRAKAPLIRFHVQVHGQDQFQFIVSFHHSCVDGWSLAALVTEVLRDYSAMLHGDAALPSSPAATYRDFAALEQATIDARDARIFWSEYLTGAVPQRLPRWPKSLCPGGHQQVRSREHQISRGVLSALKAFGHKARVPLKTVLFAAHLRVLAALQNQDEVITGLISNGRPEVLDGERVLGLFLNTVPVRHRLSEGSWLDLAQGAFSSEQTVLPHRRFPLSEVQKLIGGPALLETAFDFVHFHVYRDLQACGGLAFAEGHYFEANNLTTYTTFILDVHSTNLELHIDYDPNELCPEQVEAMCQYYLRTLQLMSEDPHALWHSAVLLPEAEQQRLLIDWNKTDAAFPSQSCIHHLFEAQAAANPNRTAVSCDGRTLTYRELDDRASQLAERLHELKVPPGALIGIYLSRSPELLVGLLGILKAGAAYVPLDPDFPPERLSLMLADSQAEFLVTESNLVRTLPNPPPKVVFLDQESTAAEPLAARVRPSSPSSGGNLAYVIFTSGSTGRPKGVQVEHHSVVNLLLSAAQTLGFNSTDRLLAVTTLSFDIASLELFMPLVTGAQVVLASREITSDPQALAALIRQSGATVMQATPATWRWLIEAGWQGSASIRIITGGEALKPDLAEKLLDRVSAAWNFYGPTETTIWSTCWQLRRGEPIVIGRPVANTRLYILNSRLQPVPLGSPGDLYIAGEGVARGYLNRPELNAKRFRLCPFAGRMYETGDVARFLPNGDVEWLGRTDQQVKIRGFRIEPGDIETALRQHPAVAEAVVSARPDSSGESRLIGYLVTHNGPPAVTELREFVRNRLPHYMIPAQFVMLKQLPLTPNGKVDLHRLPSPETHAEAPGQYIPPRTQNEAAIAAIWCEVLTLPKVSVGDDFFELGGDSLSATRAFARINQCFGSDLSLREFLDHPTVSRLAKLLGVKTLLPSKPSKIPRQPRLVAAP